MHQKEKIIITCGTFDPLTLDELHYLQKCHLKGDCLVVGIHSDWWMMWAEGGYVQTYDTRREIIKSLKIVDEIFTFNDSDGTIVQLLKLVKICYPDADITYVSKEDMHNMPETKIRGITFETMK
jgi:bifunctional ADP-heptose synthase (sugar kinase/adenylyltransferase)